MTIFEASVKAREAGLTYGKYIMLFGPFDAEPEEGRMCLQCGKPVPADRIKANNSQFCSEYCRSRRTYKIKN